MSSKQTRLQQWLNYRVRITITDLRIFVGTFMAFDRHMNLVIADCEEFRRVKVGKGADAQEKEVKRMVGMMILRGDNVLSLTAEAPPPSADKKEGEKAGGRGRGQVAGRGVPVAPAGAGGLGGAARGVGGPAPGQMQPRALAAPPPGMGRGRGM
jgi:small nuclear ribonucleoprotein B and B'